MEYISKTINTRGLHMLNSEDSQWDALTTLFVRDSSVIPVVLDENTLRECEDLAYDGLSIDAMSQGIGVSPKVFKRFLESYPQIMLRLRQAYLRKEREVAKLAHMSALEGNFNAIKYLLENRGTDWNVPVIAEDLEEAPRIQINLNSNPDPT